MSRKDKLIFALLIVLTSCTEGYNSSESAIFVETDYWSKSVETVGSKKEYLNLYNQMSDTVSSWYFNNLLPDTSKDESTQYKLLISTYKVDSLFVVNSKKDKIIGTILHTGTSKAKIWSDEIREFFGAKINGKWYFWMQASTPVVRESFKGHNLTKPLSYEQLHPNAFGTVSGYLNSNGTINDKWFEAKFKDGRSTFKDRYEYVWILDGNRIDNEEDYWNYSYRKSGTKLWADKRFHDSIATVKANK